MAWRWSVCGTAEVVWKPRFSLNRGLQLICIFWSLVSHFPLFHFRSGEFAGQSSTPTPWSFNQLLVLLAVWAGAKSCWKMKSASLKKLVSRGSMSAPKFLGKQVQWRWVFKKHNGPTPADDVAPQIITDCGNLTLDFMQLGYELLHPSSTLWTASFFGNECLWLTLLGEGCQWLSLDNCQISSLPHDCVA